MEPMLVYALVAVVLVSPILGGVLLAEVRHYRYRRAVAEILMGDA